MSVTGLLRYKTLFHELGHVILGHTTEADYHSRSNSDGRMSMHKAPYVIIRIVSELS